MKRFLFFLVIFCLAITSCHYLLPPSKRYPPRQPQTYSELSSESSSSQDSAQTSLEDALNDLDEALKVKPSYSLYKITEEETKTIDGVLYKKEILIYKDRIITISIYNRWKDGDMGHNYYGFALVYEGSGWLFLERMKIKIDNENVITLIDRSPSRTVLHGSRVRESLSFVLRDDYLKSLRKCNSLSLQPAELIEIPPEGIEKIKEFLAEQASEN